MARLSKDTCDSIISLLDAGFSTRQIGRKLGVSNFSVHKIREKYRPDAERSRGGRPAKITATEQRRLARLIASGQVTTAVQLKNLHNLHARTAVCANTVRRALKNCGLRPINRPKKPRLIPRHKALRLQFARRYQHWTNEDWKRVVWSDETKVNRIGSDGCRWAWIKPNSLLKDQHVKNTVKFGGGNLMLWGCMTARGVGYACRIDGGMNADLYVGILNDEFLATLRYYKLEPEDIVFQHDNDPKHTSRKATEWLKMKEIEVLDWPPQSPDLNPIEHLWQHLKGRLSTYESEPSSISELWCRVESEWNKIPVQVCTELIESMPRRVDAVLKARGGHTKY
jgi:transposase